MREKMVNIYFQDEMVTSRGRVRVKFTQTRPVTVSDTRLLTGILFVRTSRLIGLSQLPWLK